MEMNNHINNGGSRVRTLRAATDDPLPPSAALGLSKAGPEETGTDDPVQLREPFPAHCLPPVLREMVEHAALASQTPHSLPAAAALAVLSATIGAGLFVRSAPSRVTAANLYILGTANTGTGKSEALRLPYAPLLEEEKRRVKLWKEETLPTVLRDLEIVELDIAAAKGEYKNPKGPGGTGAAKANLLACQKTKADLQRQLTCEPCVNIGQSTGEAVGAALTSCPGEAGAIFSAEGRDIIQNILGRYGKNGSTDEPVYLQCYSGDPTVIRRLSRETVVLNAPRLTVFILIQPDLWNRISSNETMMESGLLPRCLIFDPKARPARVPTHSIPPEINSAWKKLVLTLLELYRDNPDPERVVEPSLGARDVINSLLTEAADKREAGGEWSDVAGFAARLAENAWRIALVLHTAEHAELAAKTELSEETARAAVAVARWFFNAALEALRPSREAKITARLERLKAVFAMKNTASVTLRDLERRHGFEPEEVRRLAAAFPGTLRVVAVSPGASGGRPSACAEIGSF